MGVTPPLAIVQARMGSTRLPGKMMLPLHGRPLIYHAWRRAVEAFGEEHVVFAFPASPENDVLVAYADRLGARVFSWDGDEWDVLGRLHACAHTFRWHPDSVIVRITPDDPLKDPELLRRTAMGERFAPEIGGEATTLLMLDILHQQITDPMLREHVGHIFNHGPPSPLPPGVWTVDTEEDLEAMRLRMEGT